MPTEILINYTNLATTNANEPIMCTYFPKFKELLSEVFWQELSYLLHGFLKDQIMVLIMYSFI